MRIIFHVKSISWATQVQVWDGVSYFLDVFRFRRASPMKIPESELILENP